MNAQSQPTPRSERVSRVRLGDAILDPPTGEERRVARIDVARGVQFGGRQRNVYCFWVDPMRTGDGSVMEIVRGAHEFVTVVRPSG